MSQCDSDFAESSTCDFGFISGLCFTVVQRTNLRLFIIYVCLSKAVFPVDFLENKQPFYSHLIHNELSKNRNLPENGTIFYPN